MAVLVKYEDLDKPGPANVLQLRILDLDSLPKREITQEEIDRDPVLRKILEFPVATDEQIKYMEDAYEQSRGHKL